MGVQWPTAGLAVLEMSLKAHSMTLMELRGYISGLVTEFTKRARDEAEA